MLKSEFCRFNLDSGTSIQTPLASPPGDPSVPHRYRSDQRVSPWKRPSGHTHITSFTAAAAHAARLVFPAHGVEAAARAAEAGDAERGDEDDGERGDGEDEPELDAAVRGVAVQDVAEVEVGVAVLDDAAAVVVDAERALGDLVLDVVADLLQLVAHVTLDHGACKWRSMGSQFQLVRKKGKKSRDF